jgi:RimJ/RimL family protein N-acetyltransferase
VIVSPSESSRGRSPPEAFASGDIAFRPVSRADLPMLAEWLERPHWREWWGDPATELGFIADMVEGRDTTRPYIFLRTGTPCGYIQLWYIGPHQTPEWAEENPWLMELPADAVGVDLSIADEQELSRGLGSAALRAFARELAARGFETIVIDPDPANLRAVRAYRKAGFRPVPHLEGRTQGVLIMQFQSDHNLQ